MCCAKLPCCGTIIDKSIHKRREIFIDIVWLVNYIFFVANYEVKYLEF